MMKSGALINTIIMVAILALAGCGGGGDAASAPAVTPISTSRIGTYILTSTTSDVTNIATSARQVITSSPTSNPPFTGTLKLGNTSWAQILNPGDGGAPLNLVGSYTFTSLTTTSGTFTLVNANGAGTKSGSYSTTNPHVVTFTYDPEIVNISSGNYIVISTDTWTKVSDNLL